MRAAFKVSPSRLHPLKASSLALALICWGAAAAQNSPAVAHTFDVQEFRVEGNSLLSDLTIERAVTPFMGERRSVADVEQARAALEKGYHEAGYRTVVVSIPDQKVDEGVVTLQVTEAPVARTRVEGAQYHLPSGIRQRLSQLSEGQVPNFDLLQKQLEDVNRASDLKVAPVLKAGRVPGTVEVQLEVEDQLPLHGSVELNNRQSPNTSATRLSASLRYDNLWQAGQSLGVSVQTSPESVKETRLVSLNYLWPLSTDGDVLTAYSVRSRSELATLANAPGLGMLGNTDISGLRYALPLNSSKSFVQSFTGGLDHKVVRQTLAVAGTLSASPSVRYSPFSLAWRGTWLDEGPQPATLDVSTIFGLRGMLGNKDQDFDAKRSGASANFTTIRVGAQVAESVGKNTLVAKLESQLASGPLLPSEQYVGGGVDSVRGYLEGEFAADNAVRMSLELDTPMSRPEWLPLGWRAGGAVFVDAATLRTKNAGVGQADTVTLASLGFGLRLQAPRGLNMQMDAARALRDGDVASGGTRTGDWRIHGRLAAEF